MGVAAEREKRVSESQRQARRRQIGPGCVPRLGVQRSTEFATSDMLEAAQKSRSFSALVNSPFYEQSGSPSLGCSSPSGGGSPVPINQL